MNNSVQVSDQSIQIDVSINKNEFNVDMSIVGLSKTVAEGYLVKMQQYDSTLTSIADNVSELNANVNEKALQAAASASLAEQWASSGVLVDGTDYSAKYYAESAANSAQNAAQSVTNIEELELSNQDLSNLSSEGQGILDSKLNQTQITNCVLEVPQRVKLEVSDGTITIKAGSVVIFPYGTEDLSSTYPVGATFVSSNLKVAATQYSGGRFFVWAELQSDVVNNATSDTGSTSIHYDTIRLETGLLYRSIRTESGTAAQASGTYCAYYDTTANIIRASDATTAFLDNLHLSFPIVELQADGTYWAGKVLEQYNGMGYIGSSIWLDKDVKVLAANGRNADGSINNIEYTTEGILLQVNNPNTNHLNAFWLRKCNNTIWEIKSFYSDYFHIIKNRNELPAPSDKFYQIYYIEDEAVWVYNGDLSSADEEWIVTPSVILGTHYKDTDTKITDYNPSNVFCAVDNSKYVREMEQKADVDLSNCTKPYVTETYVNGSSWYRVWSDGWCEQGGVTTLGVNQTTTVTLIKTYINTNYAILVNFKQNVNIDDNPMPYVSTTSQFKIYGTNMGSHDSWNNVAVQWVTTGYIS